MKFSRNDYAPAAGIPRKSQWKLIVLIFGLGVAIAAFDFGGSEPSGAVISSLPSSPSPEALGPGAMIDLGVLNADQFATFEDNTVGLSRAEGQALYSAIDKLKTIRTSTLARIAREDVVHSVLMADPEIYRGELIRLAGHVRRLTEHATPSDVETADGLLEAWVFTPESDIQPYRIIALSADDVIPRGPSFEPTPVEVIGMFVKRGAYASQSGTSVAPLLIAKKITHRVVAPPAAEDRLTPIFAAAVCVAMTAILGAFLMTMRAQSRRRIEFRVEANQRPAPTEIDALAPSEFLATLELESDESAHPFESSESAALAESHDG